MSKHVIDIANDFSRHPAGRYRSDGPYPGELFRKKHLVPALQGVGIVEVELDGARGIGSSFLEEAFGGLVRSEGYSAAELRSRLKLKTSDESWEEEIWDYINDAEKIKSPT